MTIASIAKIGCSAAFAAGNVWASSTRLKMKMTSQHQQEMKQVEKELTNLSHELQQLRDLDLETLNTLKIKGNKALKCFFKLRKPYKDVDGKSYLKNLKNRDSLKKLDKQFGKFQRQFKKIQEPIVRAKKEYQNIRKLYKDLERENWGKDLYKKLNNSEEIGNIAKYQSWRSKKEKLLTKHCETRQENLGVRSCSKAIAEAVASIRKESDKWLDHCLKKFKWTNYSWYRGEWRRQVGFEAFLKTSEAHWNDQWVDNWFKKNISNFITEFLRWQGEKHV